MGDPDDLWVNKNGWEVVHPPGLDEGIKVEVLPIPVALVKSEPRPHTLIQQYSPPPAQLSGPPPSSPPSPPSSSLLRLFRTRSRESDGGDQPLAGGSGNWTRSNINPGSSNPNTSPSTLKIRRVSDLFLGRKRRRDSGRDLGLELGLGLGGEEDGEDEGDEGLDRGGVDDMDGGMWPAVRSIDSTLDRGSQTFEGSDLEMKYRSASTSSTPARLVYKPLLKPLPATTHRLYPNYTPPIPILHTSTSSPPLTGDLRSTYPTSHAPGAFTYAPLRPEERAELGRGGGYVRDGEGGRVRRRAEVEVEVGEEEGKTWVGPMM